ncbi:MAG: transporter, family, proline/betaine transporter [Acetobacteraceae bacterium]|nr:transporter, family, proline/betaine transporter [Acetobacteraceae bacterium]
MSVSSVAAVGPTAAQSRRATYAATIGNVMEWYDFGVFGYLAGSLALNFFPKDDPRTSLLNTFLIFGVGLIFRPLGGIVIGRLGDKRGRKPALVLTILMMAVGTVIIGLLPTYSSIGVMAPVLLLFARLLQGFSTGGEWGGATAFMAEWSVNGRRGFYTSFQQMSVAGGGLLGVGFAALLTSTIGADAVNDWGWRVPFLVGGLFGPIGLWLRRRVDETPPYREVVAEGDAAEASTFNHGLKAFGFTVLWTVSYYVFLTYMPTYTRTQLHLTAAQSLWASTASLLVLVALVPLMGALSDRIGRKKLLLGSCALCFFIPIPAFYVLTQGYGFASVVLIQIIFAFAISLFSGAGPAAIAEIFPTRGRSTWMSSSYALAVAIFGGFAPFISQWLIDTTGSKMAPTAYVMAAAVVSFITIMGLRETAHDPLR